MFSIRRLEPDVIRPPFDCADQDLNEFYRRDSVLGGQQLMSVTYVAEQAAKVIAFFCVSNDSIKRESVPRSRLRKLQKLLAREKHYRSMPAVKIGRLGVCCAMQHQGVGTKLLDFLKYWFTHGNKTGCRFIVVDAYNRPEVILFYEKNGFEFLLTDDNNETTRLMFFDLITFRE